MEKFKSILSLEVKEDEDLREKVKECVNKMFKDSVYLKTDEHIKRDFEFVKQEVKRGVAFFDILFKEGNITAFHYSRLNRETLFIEPFFETELMYSSSVESFFKIFDLIFKRLKELKMEHPNVKQFVNYVTLDKTGENTSPHGLLGNKRLKKILNLKREEHVFNVFVLSEKLKDSIY